MSTRTVPIVEDDEDIRESLRDAFEDEGPSGLLLLKKPVHLQTMLTTVNRLCSETVRRA